MGNPKVEIRETDKYGRAVFTKEKIHKGEVIGAFDGEYYEAERAMLLPNEPPLLAGRHAIQFERTKWRDGPIDGIARCIAHSCEPNCGIKNLFEIVAMRDIQKDEEITWDYAMTENSDWRMECKCDTPSCIGTVGAYSLLSKAVRRKYNGYISEWLEEQNSN